jgi:mRNA interferase RelE/StbE
LAWTLEYDAAARKQLRKLNRADGLRILAGLEEIAQLEDPHDRGKNMKGDYAGHWRYRFGDFRVIVKIEQAMLVIEVVAVGNRREIYR